MRLWGGCLMWCWCQGKEWRRFLWLWWWPILNILILADLYPCTNTTPMKHCTTPMYTVLPRETLYYPHVHCTTSRYTVQHPCTLYYPMKHCPTPMKHCTTPMYIVLPYSFDASLLNLQRWGNWGHLKGLTS